MVVCSGAAVIALVALPRVLQAQPQRGHILTPQDMTNSVNIMRERIDKLVEVEELAHLWFREDDHERRLSRPSACWFQGTRCVTPAPPTRPRFARYQS